MNLRWPRFGRWSRLAKFHARENWYRDVWAFILTVFLAIAVSWSLSASNEAQHASVRANLATREIQAQRAETIFSSCQQQNTRHDGTIVQLDRLLLRRLHATLPGRASVAQAEGAFRRAAVRVRAGVAQSHDGTILLIDQLAPKQNCRRVVAMATRIPPYASAPPLNGKYPPVIPKR